MGVSILKRWIDHLASENIPVCMTIYYPYTAQKLVAGPGRP